MTMDKDQQDDNRGKRRRQRNWALAIALVAFVVLIYFVSIVRMGAM